MEKYTLKFIEGKVYKQITEKEFTDIIIELKKENDELKKENDKLKKILGIIETVTETETEDNIR